MGLLIEKNTTKYKSKLSNLRQGIPKHIGFLLIMTETFTSNYVYYLFLILFRFIGILIFSGDFGNNLLNTNYNSFPKWLHNITIFKIMEKIKLSITSYIVLSIILFILFISRILSYLTLYYSIVQKKNEIAKVILYRHQIFLDNLLLLLYPFLLEYLSLSYYIFFISDFVINKKNTKNYILIFIIVINTILIIGYNFLNCIFILICNKIYNSSIHDAYSKISKINLNEIKRPIKYNYNSLTIFFILLIPNFIVFSPLVYYLNENSLNKFNKIISVVIFISLFLLFLSNIKTFNYPTSINTITGVITMYCFLSILLDLLLFYFKYNIITVTSCIFYNIIKLIISCVIFYFFMVRVNNYILKRIAQSVIFQEENNNKNEEEIFDGLLFIQELIYSIIYEDDKKSFMKIVDILNSHINKCKNLKCKCKFINFFDKKYSTQDFINRINFLLETCYIEYDFIENVKINIIIAEHYCNLKKNPTMSHSIVQSLLTILKKKLHTFELVNLFLLVEKYIFYISAYSENDVVHNIREKIKNESIQLINKKKYYNQFFISFISAIRIKNLLFEYIENEIKIIKCKNLYEESLVFKYDENQENIISVETEFFKSYRNLDNNREKENFCCSMQKNNLTSIINLLLKENNIYNEIIDLIQNYQTHRDMPVHFIFRLFIFYDLFFGGILPKEIYEKIYSFFTDNKSIYHKTTSTEAYNSLIEILLNKDEKSNSKYYSIFQFKKGLRVLYFNETEAVKLGYKQKDLFKKNIDILMPKEFFKSHNGYLKRFFIYKQNKLFKVPRSFLFHKDEMNMFPVQENGSIIFGLDKYFIVFRQTMSIEKNNEYHIMLDNNFDLIAHSKNFEKDYLLNKNILNNFKINIIQIFNIKFENLYRQYKNEMKNIHLQKKLLKGKTEEYFMQLLFKQRGLVANRKRNRGSLKSGREYKILTNLNDDMGIQNSFNINDGKLLQNEESKKIIDIIINDKLIEKTHFKKITSSINKKKLINNLLQKLYKISETDLVNESNKGYSDSVIESKNKLKELLRANLSEQFYNIEIQLTFIYDKFFYFIKITEFSKNSNLSSIKSTGNFSPISEKLKQNSNTFLSYKKEAPLNDSNMVREVEKEFIENKNDKKENSPTMNLQPEKSENNEISIIRKKLNEIKKIKKLVDNDKFISIIKIILVFLLLIIFILYIILMSYHLKIVSSCYKIFHIYFYSQYTKDYLINMYSILLTIFNQVNNITSSDLFKINDSITLLHSITDNLKDSNHNLTQACTEYNDGFDVIYKLRILYKIRNEWIEISYKTDFNREVDSVIYYTYGLLNTNFSSKEIAKDSRNFFLYRGIKKHNEQINTNYFKLLYYFTKNYYKVWEIIFDEIQSTYSNSFNKTIGNIKLYYFLFACLSIILFVLLFSTLIIYLYYSNLVFFKNILYLFLDFTQDKEKYVWGKVHDNKYIIYKIQNFKLLVVDFDYELLKKFIKKIDNKNFKRDMTISINDESSELNISKNNTILPKNVVIFNDENDKKKSNMKEDNVTKLEKIGIIVKKKTRPVFFENTLNKNNFTPIKKKMLTNNDNIHGSFHTYFDKSNSGLMLNNSKHEVKNNIVNEQLNKNNEKINNNNNNKENINTGYINIQDIIMKKSEKLYIFKIKFYIIFNIVFGICFIIYTLFKTVYNFHAYNIIITSLDDFYLVVKRYAILYYYFNNLKTLLITGDNYHKSLMYEMDSEFQNNNVLFNDFVSHRLNLYSKINSLKEVFITSKNNTESLINELICKNEDLCKKLLNSNYNIFTVGIDFFFKSSITHISSVFNDFKRNENNETSIKDIHKLFINNIFERTDLAVNFVMIYAKKKLFLSFYDDIIKIIAVFDHNSTLLNIISIICPVFIFIFMILFVFKSIYNQSKPIKESTCRVNNSFILIKNYDGDKIKVYK